MSKLNNFINAFQQDHAELLKLIASFHKATEASHTAEAKAILEKISIMGEKHFNFEETYLYPRLRRLVIQITQNLHNEQQTMREFITKSRILLDRNKVNKDEISSILNTIPRLSKFFNDCNDLVFLANKFDEEDKVDLERRFKECCGRENLVTV